MDWQTFFQKLGKQNPLTLGMLNEYFGVKRNPWINKPLTYISLL